MAVGGAAGDVEEGGGLGGGVAGGAESGFVEAGEGGGVGVAGEAAGMARAGGCVGRFDQPAADAHGGGEADLLAGDGPAEGFEGRGGLGHAQAGEAGEEGAELRVIPVGGGKFGDGLVEAQQVAGEGGDFRGIGRGAVHVEPYLGPAG